MTHEQHAASCKFCRLPVTLRIHSEALGMFDITKWLSLASCNRCADYHAKRLAITAAVQKVANNAMIARTTLPEEEQHEPLGQCRSSLEKLTRRLAENASEHYRCGFTWEPDWVTQILIQPDKATLQCTFYERQMWKDWNKRRTVAMK